MQPLPELKDIERQPWMLPEPTDAQRNLLVRAELAARDKRYDPHDCPGLARDFGLADPYCEACGGSGEGAHESQVCSECNGSGHEFETADDGAVPW